jgi:two-component system capsular synthesis sensor histidine kinase RcsC
VKPEEEFPKVKLAWEILVVDDEPSVCEAIKMMLEHDGHRVQMANSGSEALGLLEQRRFDLVTTDFSMPGMNGDALAAAIKERLPNLPILMVSGNAARAMSSGNPLLGVDLVIWKPFLLADLRKAIDSLLRK